MNIRIYEPGQYGKNFKMMQLRPSGHPKDAKSWVYFLWGFDIFFGPIPFLKLVILINVLLVILRGI